MNPDRRAAGTNPFLTPQFEAVDDQPDRSSDFRECVDSIHKAVENYSVKNPAVVTVAVFFAGVYVGWKIKPW